MMVSNILTILIFLLFIHFMSNLFIRFYRYLMDKQIVSTDHVFPTNSVQQDPATVETVKQIRKTFEEQQDMMDARALKAHSVSCPDTWMCAKDVCFVHEPDKIVATTIIPSRLTKERIEGRVNFEIINKRSERWNKERLERRCLQDTCILLDVCECPPPPKKNSRSPRRSVKKE